MSAASDDHSITPVFGAVTAAPRRDVAEFSYRHAASRSRAVKARSNPRTANPDRDTPMTLAAAAPGTRGRRASSASRSLRPKGAFSRHLIEPTNAILRATGAAKLLAT